jgi:Cytochrome C'
MALVKNSMLAAAAVAFSILSVSVAGQVIVAGPALAAADTEFVLPDFSGLSMPEIVDLRRQVMGLNVRALGTAASLTGQEAAKAGEDLAINAQLLKILFPEASIGTSAVASPAIWEDWDRFIGYLDDLEALGNEMKAAATAGDTPAYLAAVEQANNTCAVCHQAFRR